MSEKIYQVRIGGEAGQGVILAGVLLAQAAAEAGMQVAQSARYGAAVRGGEATSDVVISSESIDFPHVESPDYLVVISQSTYDKFAPVQAEGTLVISDPFFVKSGPLKNVRHIELAATDAAIKRFGKSTSANLVLLGALVELSNVASMDSLRAAVEHGVSAKFKKANFEALEMGRKMAQAAVGGGIK